MINKFARIAIALNILGVVMCAIQPSVLRMHTYFQFHQLGMESGRVADELVKKLMPYVVFGCLLHAAGVFAAMGILRRKNWARIMWITLCAVSTGLTLVSFHHEHDWMTFAVALFRGGLLLGSVWLLCSAETKEEFLQPEEHQDLTAPN